MFNFPSAKKMFIGNTEIAFLQMQNEQFWSSETKVENITFPSEYMNILGRAYDPYKYENLIVESDDISGTVAGLGDKIGTFIPVSANNVSSDGTVSANTEWLVANTEIAGNTHKPELALIAGRRCLKFSGAQMLVRNAIVDMRTIPEFTIGMMIHTTANTTGVPINISRSNLISSRSALFAHFIDASPNYLRPRSRFDGGVMTEDAASFGSLSPTGWKILWLEWDFDNGNLYGQFNDNFQDYDFTTSYGLDASDSILNRLSLGARLDGTIPATFFTGYIGRFFWACRTFIPQERETLVQWLKGTKYLSA